MSAAKLCGRLSALEAQAAKQLEEVGAQKWVVLCQAEAQLSPADLAAWQDAGRVLSGEEEGVLPRLSQAWEGAGLPSNVPITHPAKEEASAWLEAALDVPDLSPFTAPPASRVADFTAYLEACAQWCEQQATRADLAPECRRVAGWGAAMWRLNGALCRVLGAGA